MNTYRFLCNCLFFAIVRHCERHILMWEKCRSSEQGIVSTLMSVTYSFLSIQFHFRTTTRNRQPSSQQFNKVLLYSTRNLFRCSIAYRTKTYLNNSMKKGIVIENIPKALAILVHRLISTSSGGYSISNSSNLFCSSTVHN